MRPDRTCRHAPQLIGQPADSWMLTRRLKAGRSCRARTASTHLRPDLTHRADGKIVRLRLAERVPPLPLSNRLEAQLDHRQLLKQLAIILSRSARTQPCQQVAVEIDFHRRSHADSVPPLTGPNDSAARSDITPVGRVVVRASDCDPCQEHAHRTDASPSYPMEPGAW